MFKRKSFYFPSVLLIIGSCFCSIFLLVSCSKEKPEELVNSWNEDAQKAEQELSETSSVTSTFIGDAAAEGLLVTERDGAFSVEVLTIVNLAQDKGTTVLSSPVALSVSNGDIVTATTVNFYAENAGNLVPFIALIADGTDLRDFANYEIVAVGDTVSATGAGLVNGIFNVGGAAASSFEVTADGQLVAGFVANTERLVTRSRNDGGISDIVLTGIGVTSASVGGGIIDPPGTNFDKFPDTQSFNIGIDVVAAP